jgi:hypothetical protein
MYFSPLKKNKNNIVSQHSILNSGKIKNGTYQYAFNNAATWYRKATGEKTTRST